MEMKKTPNEIRIRGARVHNLKNVDVNRDSREIGLKL